MRPRIFSLIRMRSPAVLSVSRLVLLLGPVLANVSGCGGGGSNSVMTNNPPPNRAPTISTITPTSASASGSAFTLTVKGTGLIASSAVGFNGTA
jgi:hypothetical protein